MCLCVCAKNQNFKLILNIQGWLVRRTATQRCVFFKNGHGIFVLVLVFTQEVNVFVLYAFTGINTF